MDLAQVGLVRVLAHPTLGRDSDDELVRKAGVMGIVLEGGTVRPGDPMAVELPKCPHRPLDRV